jgi:hypothetical protein
LTKNNIKELSIQVNLSGLSFCILNRTLNTIEYLNTTPFEQKLTPFDVLNRLKTELSTNTIFSDEFDSVMVIHQNELVSLVPKDLFDENHKVDYLKFNAKILKTDFITQDNITINNSVNVYIPYVNINNYIFETFGAFVYKHSSTILIDTILQKPTANNTPQVYININNTTLEVSVIDKNKLKLFNVFEYHSKEDFIYYVLFVFEQLKLDVETTSLELSGNIKKDDELYTVLYTYIRHIAIVIPEFNFNFTKDIKKEHIHNYYLILNSF